MTFISNNKAVGGLLSSLYERQSPSTTNIVWGCVALRVCALTLCHVSLTVCAVALLDSVWVLTCLHCCVSLCARLDVSLCKPGHSLVLYYCDYRHYDLCWRQAIQHSMLETWNCDSVFLERAVKVATVGQKSGLAVLLISIHPNQCIHPSGACSCTAVWSASDVNSNSTIWIGAVQLACLQEWLIYLEHLNTCMHWNVQ